MKYVAITDGEDDEDNKVTVFHGNPIGFVGLMNLISQLDDGDSLVILCYEEWS